MSDNRLDTMLNETERKNALLRFIAAVKSMPNATHELLDAWESVEMGTGDTPSDVDGYPYKESLDDHLFSVKLWAIKAEEWATHLLNRPQDYFVMTAIVEHINSKVALRAFPYDGQGSEKAQLHNSGGGIIGILLPVRYGCHAFWGTANEDWGADVSESDGELLGHINTPVPCNHQDLRMVAEAILLYTAEYARTMTPPPVAPVQAGNEPIAPLNGELPKATEATEIDDIPW